MVSLQDPVATEITVNSTTLINDTIYLIGNTAQMLVVPKYLKFPSYVDVDYFFELVAPVPYASIVVDPVLGPCVKIVSTNPLDFGLH